MHNLKFMVKKVICSIFLSAIAVTQAWAAEENFAIVIDPKSYDEAKTEVLAYASAVETYNNLKTTIVIDRWGIPDSIRAELVRLHSQKKSPLVGAVFIGDIPVPMLRDAQHMTSAFKMRQSQPREESSVPSDRFYDDFGLKFDYIERDTDNPYFYYSLRADSEQRVHPDIFSGRIRPTDAGGTSRYDKLRDYLRKVVAVKSQRRSLNSLFYFSGHGYISESKVARIDEKAAYFEHFPWMKGRKNVISYIDHTDQNPVKERLMNEVMRSDLDLAILHHHGFYDTEYLNSLSPVQTVREAKEFIIRSCREHVYEANQRGRNADSLRVVFSKRFDLPESWLADALNDSIAAADSLYEALSDLHIEDFKVYGYQPNAPVVLIDACFCGSFHQDDCIANEYIFQPGSTVAVVANTVNALQDKWSDHLIGLTALGGCVGDAVRFSGLLESHVIGDPTFAYKPVGTQYDINKLLLDNNASAWRKLLKSDMPDIQSLAMDRLTALNTISSAELLKVYQNSPYGIVRMQALLSLSAVHDDNFITCLEEASQDSYEFVQRQAIRYFAESGDERLVPSLISLCISNNTSTRCNFNASTALGCFPKDVLLKEFARQFDDASLRYVRKDSVRRLIETAVEHSADRVAFEVDSLIDNKVDNVKYMVSMMRAMRNSLPHHLVPKLLDYYRDIKDVDLQVAFWEMLGWHPLSCHAKEVAAAALKESLDETKPQKVRNEALKTYNRLMAR